jgi:plasmid stabilization system protein ParE
MRVRYTPRAFADREAIFDFINRRNPHAAREVKAFIQKRIMELGDLEIRHRKVPKLGVHALWLGRYPYIVYYRVGRDEIAIVHIRHVAQRPWEGEGD